MKKWQGEGGRADKKTKKGESDKSEDKGKTDTENNRAKTRSTSTSSSGQTNLDGWRGGKRRLSIGEKSQDLAGSNKGNTGKVQTTKGGRGGGVKGKEKTVQKL